MSIVKRNVYGYWESRFPDNCVLLSTLNVLEESGKLDEDKAQKIAERFFDLWLNDRSSNFKRIINIPKTIEKITDDEFYGVMVHPNSTEILRSSGIENAEKYAIDSQTISSSLCPHIICNLISESKCHAIAVVRFWDDLGAYKLVDDGLPVIKTVSEVFRAYRVLENSPQGTRQEPNHRDCFYYSCDRVL